MGYAWFARGSFETRSGREQSDVARMIAGLFSLNAAMLGAQFAWALQTVFGTPLFVDLYKVNPKHIGFIRLAGPL